MAQQQVQKQVRKPSRPSGTPADAPTVNQKIAKLWFGKDSQ